MTYFCAILLKIIFAIHNETVTIFEPVNKNIWKKLLRRGIVMSSPYKNFNLVHLWNYIIATFAINILINKTFITFFACLKMLLSENLVAYLKFHLKLQKFQGTFPLEFSHDQRQMKSSKNKLKWQYFKAILHSIFVLVLWIQLFLAKDHEPLNTWMEGCIFSVAHFAYCFAKWMILTRKQIFADFFNAMVQFERQHVCKKGEKMTKNL